MRTAPRLLALAVLSVPFLTVPPVAEARPLKVQAHGKKTPEEARSRAAIAASEGFTARMGRLDALMGGTAPAARTRSANAEP